MKPTRREIFRAGALGAMAAGLGACDLGSATPGGGAGGHAVPDSVLASSAYALDMASFLPHVGTRFRLAGGGGGASTELTLVRVTDLGAGARAHGECFALSFNADGAAGAELGQDTYTASHAALGSFPLFVVPGRSDSGAAYSAVFNRV